MPEWLEQFTNPLNLVLLVFAAIAFAAWRESFRRCTCANLAQAVAVHQVHGSRKCEQAVLVCGHTVTIAVDGGEGVCPCIALTK